MSCVPCTVCGLAHFLEVSACHVGYFLILAQLYLGCISPWGLISFVVTTAWCHGTWNTAIVVHFLIYRVFLSLGPQGLDLPGSAG